MFQEHLPGVFAGGGFDYSANYNDGLHEIPPQLCNYALTKWLDCESKARMLISSGMVVHWMSAAAEDLVEQGIIRIIDGKMAPRTPLVSGFLHNASLAEHSCVIFQDCQDKPWVVWARRLCGPPISLIGLNFHPPKQSACFTALVDTHILTPTEGRVVEMLLNGYETGRIAQALNISSQTLKTHIKHAYCKLGVSSRGDLFAHAAGFARP